MRPPQAGDYKPLPRLRILYIQKHAPYNSGEERVVASDIARKLCILGVAVPAQKRDEDDPYGGWGLNPAENHAREQLNLDSKIQAGDYAEEVAQDQKALKEEVERVEGEAKAKKDKKKDKDKAKPKPKPKGFAKGKKDDGDAAATGKA